MTEQLAPVVDKVWRVLRIFKKEGMSDRKMTLVGPLEIIRLYLIME